MGLNDSLRERAAYLRDAYHTLGDTQLRRTAFARAFVRGAERRTKLTYIGLDYPPAADPGPRYGWGKPPHPQLTEIIARRRDLYVETLLELLRFRDDLARIPLEPSSNDPGWVQQPPWILGLDGASLYGFVRSTKPARYVEVGSGNSTKFVARARRDGALDTHITSIDPHPRAEIDALCDAVIRSPLESCEAGVFQELGQGDVVFFDGSHRAYMNSDAVVFFLEVLPSLAPGVLVGIHDIFLPSDYPPQWIARYYSEQYLLGCYLLGGGDLVAPTLPCYYVSSDPVLGEVLAPLWSDPAMNGVDTRGFTFWLTRTETAGNRAEGG